MTSPAEHTTREPRAGTRHLTVRCPICQSWNRIDASRIPDRPKCGSCGRPLLLDRPLLLNDDDFTRTIEASEVPVLVDFFADWCGPCKMMAPTVDALAARMQGTVLVAKVNTDASPRTAGAFQIRGIPTSIAFRNGREVGRHVGLANAIQLEGLVTPSR